MRLRYKLAQRAAKYARSLNFRREKAMEKKEKRWRRRGVFALVSNRERQTVESADDLLFPADEENEADEPEEDR